MIFHSNRELLKCCSHHRRRKVLNVGEVGGEGSEYCVCGGGGRQWGRNFSRTVS